MQHFTQLWMSSLWHVVHEQGAHLAGRSVCVLAMPAPQKLNETSRRCAILPGMDRRKPVRIPLASIWSARALHHSLSCYTGWQKTEPCWQTRSAQSPRLVLLSMTVAHEFCLIRVALKVQQQEPTRKVRKRRKATLLFGLESASEQYRQL